MRAAIIDIGSSTVKLVIGEEDGREIKILESLKNVVDIGRDTFFKGRISQSTIKRTIGILENYKEILGQYQVAEVRVIATTAVREARNQEIFLDTVKRKTGYQIEVLNVGDVVFYIDAFLSFKIKKDYPVHERNLLIAELGAGSLDLSIMEKGFTLFNLGIPLGTLRLNQFRDRIDSSLEETYQALEEYAEKHISTVKNFLPSIRIDDIILIDENYSGYMQQILPQIRRDSHFFKFLAKDSRLLTEKLTSRNPDDLALEAQIPAEIADSLDAYVIVLNVLFKLSRQKRYLYILETSLSEALLANIIFGVELSQKYNKANQLISVARFLCRKYQVDMKHARQVADLSEKLFEPLREPLGLDVDDRLYLILAAYLHNIGLFISNRSHHKHSEFIISSLNLFRLREAEIGMIACIARYHRKSGPLKTHPLYNSLTLAEQLVVQKLSAILRIAAALDSAHKQKVKDVKVTTGSRQELVLTVASERPMALERQAFQEKKSLFEEISGSRIVLRVKPSLK